MFTLILFISVLFLLAIVLYQMYSQAVGTASCKKCDARERADKAFQAQKERKNTRRKSAAVARENENDSSDGDISD